MPGRTQRAAANPPPPAPVAVASTAPQNGRRVEKLLLGRPLLLLFLPLWCLYDGYRRWRMQACIAVK